MIFSLSVHRFRKVGSRSFALRAKVAFTGGSRVAAEPDYSPQSRAAATGNCECTTELAYPMALYDWCAQLL